MKKIIAIAIIITSLVSCDSSNEKLSWMLGNWKMENDGYDVYESWSNVNDTLKGISYFKKNGDSTLQEEVMILENDLEKMSFNVKLNQGNDGKVITFNEAESGEHFILFTNKQHDFPQNIRYERKNDSLLVKISGSENGFDKEFDVKYIRIK